MKHVTLAELIHYGANIVHPSTLGRRMSSSVEITDDNVFLHIDVVCFSFQECDGINFERTSLIHHGPVGISRAPEERLLSYPTLELRSNRKPVGRYERIIGDKDPGKRARTWERYLRIGEKFPQHEPRWGSVVVDQGEPTPGRAAAVREAGRRSTDFYPLRTAMREVE
jgi:hypothetical protein